MCVEEWGTGTGGGGAIIPNSYYTVTTRMISALLKTGSDERHFNVSFTVSGKITHEAVSKTPQHLKNKERPSRCPSSCRSPSGGDSLALGTVSHLNTGVILVVTM